MLSERVLLRIFLTESDRSAGGAHGGEPLYQAVLELLREEGVAGATVLRGIAGYGASARLHLDRVLRLSLDLPLVIEAVDTDERIRAALPALEALRPHPLITLERVQALVPLQDGDAAARTL